MPQEFGTSAETTRAEKPGSSGMPVSWMLAKLNAASWFSDANKLYNSGQRAYREGRMSPWAMVLACEGLGLSVRQCIKSG